MSSVNTMTTAVLKFQSSVKKLSDNISSAGYDWNDEKHAALTGMVAEIASNAKGVMSTAEHMASRCREFDSVASQN